LPIGNAGRRPFKNNGVLITNKTIYLKKAGYSCLLACTARDVLRGYHQLLQKAALKMAKSVKYTNTFQLK
jgi:hypothetical protein